MVPVTLRVGLDTPVYLVSLLCDTYILVPGVFNGSITVSDIADLFSKGEVIDGASPYSDKMVVLNSGMGYCWRFTVHYRFGLSRKFDRLKITAYDDSNCSGVSSKPPVFSLTTGNRDLIMLLLGKSRRPISRIIDVSSSEVLDNLRHIPLYVLSGLLSEVPGVQVVSGKHRFTGNILEVVTLARTSGVRFTSKRGDSVAYTAIVPYPPIISSPPGLFIVSVVKRDGRVVRSEFAYYYGSKYGVNVSRDLGMRIVISNPELAWILDFSS